jgi:hypothetical protein
MLLEGGDASLGDILKCGKVAVLLESALQFLIA